jgi:hypothetical protein
MFEDRDSGAKDNRSGLIPYGDPEKSSIDCHAKPSATKLRESGVVVVISAA